MSYVPPDPDDFPSAAELAYEDFSVPKPLRFTVYGTPQPAGSKRAFPIKRKDGRRGVAVTDDNPRAKAWQGDVAAAGATALVAWDDSVDLLEGPLAITLAFTFARPRGHYRTGRNAHLLKPSAPRRPITRPDTTKLIRAVEDALTGVVWRDDAQVVYQLAVKDYGTPERVDVAIWRT